MTKIFIIFSTFILLISCTCNRTSSKTRLIKRQSQDTLVTKLKSNTTPSLDSNITTHKKDTCSLLELKNGSKLYISDETFSLDTVSFKTCDNLKEYEHFITVENIKSIVKKGDTTFYNPSTEFKEDQKDPKQRRKETIAADKLGKAALFMMLGSLLLSILVPELALFLAILVGLYILFLFITGKTKKMSRKRKLIADVIGLIYISFFLLVGLVVLFIQLLFW